MDLKFSKEALRRMSNMTETQTMVGYEGTKKRYFAIFNGEHVVIQITEEGKEDG